MKAVGVIKQKKKGECGGFKDMENIVKHIEESFSSNPQTYN